MRSKYAADGRVITGRNFIIGANDTFTESV